jgi:hypothetical protein
MDKWRDFVKAVMNFFVAHTALHSVTSRGSLSFSKRNSAHEVVQMLTLAPLMQVRGASTDLG